MNSTKCRVLNSVMEVSAFDGERSDSGLRHICKLQVKDYQNVLDGLLALIATVNQTLAHKTRHSQQPYKIPKMMESFFRKNCDAFATDFQNIPALNAQRNI
jgi:hypothetical protein